MRLTTGDRYGWPVAVSDFAFQLDADYVEGYLDQIGGQVVFSVESVVDSLAYLVVEGDTPFVSCRPE